MGVVDEVDEVAELLVKCSQDDHALSAQGVEGGGEARLARRLYLPNGATRYLRYHTYYTAIIAARVAWRVSPFFEVVVG